MAIFSCIKCPANCASISNLKIHLKNAHNPNSFLHSKCYPNLNKPLVRECKVYDNQEALIKHLLAHHKGMKKCESQGCDFVGTKKNMKGHVNNKHNSENVKDPRVKCQKCQEWRPQSKLPSHMESCKGPKKIECEQCDKIFPTKTRLKKHIKSAHDTPFNTCVCEFCQEEFKVTHLLRKHIKAKHNQKWVEKCANNFEEVDEKKHCKNCDITFRDTAALKKHQKSHHCPCCQMKMATPEAVIKHLRKVQTDLEIKMKEAQNRYGDFELTKEGHLLWCVICKISVNNLQTHQSDHHTCKTCSGIFDLPKHDKYCKSTTQNDDKIVEKEAIKEPQIENDDQLDEDVNEITSTYKCDI